MQMRPGWNEWLKLRLEAEAADWSELSGTRSAAHAQHQSPLLHPPIITSSPSPLHLHFIHPINCLAALEGAQIVLEHLNMCKSLNNVYNNNSNNSIIIAYNNNNSIKTLEKLRYERRKATETISGLFP